MIYDGRRQRRNRACSADGGAAGSFEGRIHCRRKVADKTASIREIKIMHTRHPRGSGDSVPLLLERPCGVNQQFNSQLTQGQ